MALQDIITAITSQADRDIAALREAHEHRVKDMRTQQKEAMASLRSTMLQEVEVRKSQLLQKVKTHAAVERRNRISAVKQAVVNAAFSEAIAILSSLPDEKIEPLLRACLQQIRGHGTLHASKRHAALLRKIAPTERFTIDSVTDVIGGFRFVGATSEADYTFEHLVHGVLRRKKELDVARVLFPKHTK